MLARTIFFAIVVFWAAGEKASAQQGFTGDIPSRISKEEVSSIWNRMSSFFGEDFPKVIRLTKGDMGGTSDAWFDPDSDPIVVTLKPAVHQYDRQSIMYVIGHESSHLGMLLLTATGHQTKFRFQAGASYFNQFRFLDEGFVSLLGHEIAGDIGEYKKRVFLDANHALKNGDISLHLVKNWHSKPSHYGAPGVFDEKVRGYFERRYAYQVGASFILYLESMGGRPELFNFFKNLGKTEDLETSLSEIYGKNFDTTKGPILQQAEMGWMNFISSSTASSWSSAIFGPWCGKLLRRYAQCSFFTRLVFSSTTKN